jgi:hypothetical protein
MGIQASGTNGSKCSAMQLRRQPLRNRKGSPEHQVSSREGLFVFLEKIINMCRISVLAFPWLPRSFPAIKARLFGGVKI